MDLNSFPLNAPTAPISATQASSRVAIPGTEGGKTLRICNAGSAWAFAKGGDSTVVAATTDTPLGPGAIETFTLGSGDTHIAAICATGQSAALFIQRGIGQ